MIILHVMSFFWHFCMTKSMSLKEAKQLPPTTLLRILKKMKNVLREDPVMQAVFKEYDVDIAELEYIPMTFKNLDVSAKCDHAVIYFNYSLLCDGNFEKNYSYAIHEITHYLQQTTGSRPTQSSDEGSYLHNKNEQEGFANQVKYIAKENGKEEAKEYVEDLLDHHEIEDKKEEKKLTDVLLNKVD